MKIRNLKQRIYVRDKFNIMVGDIYEDCMLHPCRATKVWINRHNKYDSDVEGISLIDGTFPHSCSIFHCRPCRLTQQEAEAKIKAFADKGERGLMHLAGYTEQDTEQFMKDWR